MKVTALVEKVSDGYSCHLTRNVKHCNIAGYGETAREAVEDMMVCYNEMKEMNEEEGKPTPELDITYKYDLFTFFQFFSYLNISEVARLAGINASLLRRYASGISMASEQQYTKVATAIDKITKELSASTF